MLFSPDFLRFFEATAVLLELDDSLFCISAWNDNGRQEDFNWDQRRMFRTSYFPGLVSCHLPCQLMPFAANCCRPFRWSQCGSVYAGLDDQAQGVDAPLAR